VTVEANPSGGVDGCSFRFSEMNGKCDLGQLRMILSIGPTLRSIYKGSPLV